MNGKMIRMPLPNFVDPAADVLDDSHFLEVILNHGMMTLKQGESGLLVAIVERVDGAWRARVVKGFDVALAAALCMVRSQVRGMPG